MADFEMGGKTVEIPEMNFAAVERAWPFITEAMQSRDIMDGSRAAIAVIAAGILEAESFNPTSWDIDLQKIDTLRDVDTQVFDQLQRTIKRRLLAREMGMVSFTVITMVKEAGLMPEEGELLDHPLTVEPTSPSTEIADGSSLSS